MNPAAAKFWIGPSGWSYPDWQGVVYPRPKPRGFKPLEFIGRYFNAVEVNSSFYAVPTPRTTSAWPAQTPADFRFAFKLTRTFTHETGRAPDAKLLKSFTEALAPVREAGKLGPVLMQFPWSFRYSTAATERLRRLADGLAGFELATEVRHSSWTRPEALEALRQTGGICNIDQPLLRDCIEPAQRVFGEFGYVRLHGRNYEKWFARNISPHERYEYLYNLDELRRWIMRLRAIGKQAANVFVFANNHYWGRSTANALEIVSLLEDRRVAVPPQLLLSYERLRAIAAAPSEQPLFDGFADDR